MFSSVCLIHDRTVKNSRRESSFAMVRRGSFSALYPFTLSKSIVAPLTVLRRFSSSMRFSGLLNGDGLLLP